VNLIYIGTDTWRADYLGCYGSSWVKTPNVDWLAAESVRFTNAYAEALPTLPMRRAVFCGKSTLPFEPVPRGKRFPGRSPNPQPGWGPLHREDVTFADVLAPTDYNTGLICDCYHFFKPDMNLHAGFKSWEWIRGQEADAWRSGPIDAVDMPKILPRRLRSERAVQSLRKFCLNNLDAHSEEDRVCARTIRAAMRWLGRNHRQGPFALWLEMFDPHEPWDPPQRFREMYEAVHPECERFIFGYGVPIEKLRPEEVELLKRLYAGAATFTDLWIGRLLDFVRALGLLEDTIVVFTTDHGTHLGEEGCIHKQARFLNSMFARIPLLIRHPDVERYGGKTVNALVSAIDLVPTLLDLLGVEKPSCMTGLSAWSLAAGKELKIRDRVFAACGDYAAVREERWHYFRRLTSDGGEPPSPCLYDLENDPGETANVISQHPDALSELDGQLARKFQVEL